MNNNDITDLLVELYSEVTPRGKITLNKLVDKIVFELESIRQSVDMEENE